MTTDFTYVRWLGNREDIKRLDRIQIDRSEDIDAWAERLERVARQVQRIYGFMNNHYAGHSPGSVADLKGRLRLPSVDPRSAWPAGQPVQQSMDLA